MFVRVQRVLIIEAKTNRSFDKICPNLKKLILNYSLRIPILNIPLLDIRPLERDLNSSVQDSCVRIWEIGGPITNRPIAINNCYLTIV